MFLDTIFSYEFEIKPDKNEKIKYDTLLNQYYFDYKKSEWGPDLNFGLDSITNNKNNIAVISAIN